MRKLTQAVGNVVTGQAKDWVMVRAIGIVVALAFLVACGSDSPAPAAHSEGGTGGPAAAASSGSGPDTSDLADIVLGKINGDPMRQELKVSGKLLDFSIVSANAEVLGDEASAVVECAGTVEFDGDTDWGMSGIKKAGEPAKFECRAEYVTQGGAWQLFGPMGIYPL